MDRRDLEPGYRLLESQPDTDSARSTNRQSRRASGRSPSETAAGARATRPSSPCFPTVGPISRCSPTAAATRSIRCSRLRSSSSTRSTDAVSGKWLGVQTEGDEIGVTRVVLIESLARSCGECWHLAASSHSSRTPMGQPSTARSSIGLSLGGSPHPSSALQAAPEPIAYRPAASTPLLCARCRLVDPSLNDRHSPGSSPPRTVAEGGPTLTVTS